jgi:hypothetical protein
VRQPAAVASRHAAAAAAARRARVLSGRRPCAAQCYEKPSPGRILSPKDNLNQLQGATIEVRAAAVAAHARLPAPLQLLPPPPVQRPRLVPLQALGRRLLGFSAG